MTIRWLSETTRGDVSIAGGKGANLGEMVRLGLPVPDGFCITAPTYAEHVQAWGLADTLAEALREQDWERAAALAQEACTSMPLADGMVEATLAAYRQLGEPAVAVRSSATAEDLADASFAGQQETFLNVSGEAALLEAVRRCWASLWSPRALHYRRSRGIDHLSVAIAVVVQTMVPAEAAGVLFTVDPVAQRADRLLIQAARGLGENVVSGSVTGDSYAVERVGGPGERTDAAATHDVDEPAIVQRDLQDPQHPVLTDGQILDLSRVGLRLEAHFGAPQDLEFAVAAGRLYLLQSRPITTLAGAEPEPIPPLGKLTPFQRTMSAIADERYPVAPKPLDNYIVAALMGAPVNAFRTMGFVIPQQVEAEWLGRIWREGYVYPPMWPGWRLAGSGLFMIRMLREDWQAWWDNGPRQQLEALSQPVNLESLSDAALLARADQIRALFTDLLMTRFQASTGMAGEDWLKALLGWVVGKRQAPGLLADLMAGLQTRTSETNQALWDVSRQIRRAPAALAAVAAGRFEHLGEVEGGTAIANRVAQLLAEYGHRECVTWYLSTPTWRGNPAHVWGLLQGLVGATEPPADRGTERYLAALAMLQRRLRFRPELRRPILWLVERLRVHQTFRDNSHFDLTRGLAAIQEVAREWGDRLTQRGLLAQPQDVFYLTHEEVRRWLTEEAPEPAEARHLIARRRLTYQIANGRWQKRQFESKNALALGEHGGKARNALTSGEQGGAARGGAGSELRGVAAGSGIVRARARIVRGEAQFGRLQPGEVLVCPYTNPSWTPLFASAAAVVAETGGAGAHAAIVAREYGIPAVMGVAGATRLIADGQEILVDGGSGRVVLGAR